MEPELAAAMHHASSGIGRATGAIRPVPTGFAAALSPALFLAPARAARACAGSLAAAPGGRAPAPVILLPGGGLAGLARAAG